MAAWALLPLALSLLRRRWWAAGAAALAALALAGCVLPRWFAADPTGAGGPVLRVLTANLLGGEARPDSLVELVRRHRVDVLAVQELTGEAQAALDGLGIADLLPYRQAEPLPGTAGSALFSRFPLSDGGARHNPGGFAQAYATVRVGVRGAWVHPLAGSDHRTVLAELAMPE